MRYLLPALCVLWMIFIWHFSFSPATESAETSDGVLEILNGLLEKTDIAIRFSGHMVRKTAHFAEFFVLGCLAAGAGLSLWLEFPFFTAGLAVVFTALTDETIQRFVPGRAARFTDVLLDSTGGICGVLAVFLFYLLAMRRKRKLAACRGIPQNK